MTDPYPEAHQGVPEPAADLTSTVEDVREERIAKILESAQSGVPDCGGFLRPEAPDYRTS